MHVREPPIHQNGPHIISSLSHTCLLLLRDQAALAFGIHGIDDILLSTRSHKYSKLEQIQHHYSTFPIHPAQRSISIMNSVATIFVILATIVQLSSALLFSPLLLRTNPFGVVKTTPSSMKSPESLPRPQSVAAVDYGHDEDVLRYKYDILQSVYEKSLERGFGEQ